MLCSARKAFTMLELILVIIILGIVSSIGSTVIAQVYEGYIVQRATHRASIKTEMAINQISNRLAYRMQDSLIAREPKTDNILVLKNITNTTVNRDLFTALEWIGYENDGFSAASRPGWSGFADLQNSIFSTITTIGSSLSPYESTVLDNLGMSATPAIRFMTTEYRSDNNAVYDSACLHALDGNGCMFPVNFSGMNSMVFTSGGDRQVNSMTYAEFYQLSGSAYAVVPENENSINGIVTWDLMLYYNYAPWNGERYEQGLSSLLAKNVSVFRFKEEANSVRLKICVVEQIAGDQTMSLCKEKAVIR